MLAEKHNRRSKVRRMESLFIGSVGYTENGLVSFENVSLIYGCSREQLEKSYYTKPELGSF